MLVDFKEIIKQGTYIIITTLMHVDFEFIAFNPHIAIRNTY